MLLENHRDLSIRSGLVKPSVFHKVKNLDWSRLVSSFVISCFLYFTCQLLLNYFSGASYLSQFLAAFNSQVAIGLFGTPLSLKTMSTMIHSVVGLSTFGISYMISKSPVVKRPVMKMLTLISGVFASAMQSSQDRLNYSPIEHQNQHRFGLFSAWRKLSSAFIAVNHFCKGMVALMVPDRLFKAMAQVIPIGGWIEYTPSFAGEMNELLHVSAYGTEKQLSDLLDILPKESLYRMLQARGTRLQFSALTLAAQSSIKGIKKFGILLAAIEPQYRVQFLKALEGVMARRVPVIHKLQLSQSKKTWRLMKSLLTRHQLKELFYAMNPQGDSLLMNNVRLGKIEDVIKIISVYSREERIEYLTQMCPHGFNVVFRLFGAVSFSTAKKLLPMLPQKEWQAIFSQTPPGWTMMLGEKLMLTFNASLVEIEKEIIQEKRRGVNNVLLLSRQGQTSESIIYFREHFKLDLPNCYKDLPSHELKEKLSGLLENVRHANCITKAQFIEKHGANPEEILGLEPMLEPRAYTVAYRQLQLKYHPDKNSGESAELSARINAAKLFIESEEERKSFYPH